MPSEVVYYRGYQFHPSTSPFQQRSSKVALASHPKLQYEAHLLRIGFADYSLRSFLRLEFGLVLNFHDKLQSEEP
jgi:hypothetical protein